MKITTLSPKPENACSSVTSPVNQSAMHTASAISMTGNRPQTKSATVVPMMVRRMAPSDMISVAFR
jgi:hypothetical protein